jgi:hypothetical protein
MALDLSLIKEELNRLQNPRSSKTRKNMWWRPSELGKTYNVRLVAFPDNDGKPFVLRRVYKNINGWRSEIAPYQFGDPDPVQDVIDTLQERRKSASKGEQEEINKLLKGLYPKEQYYALVLERGSEEDGLKFWTISQTMVQQLYSFMLDDEVGDLTDPKTGTDLKITRTNNNGKTNTTVVPARKSSKLASTDAEIQSILDNAPKVDEYNKAKSFDELKELVSAWVDNGGVFNKEGESSRFVPTTPPAAPQEDEPSSVADSLAAIDAAFSI